MSERSEPPHGRPMRGRREPAGGPTRRAQRGVGIESLLQLCGGV